MCKKMRFHHNKTIMATVIGSREIWKIACPIMLGNLAQTIITFTDTAFLGHLGITELSASMMACLNYFVFTTLAMGFGVGVQIYIARRYGEGRFDQIGVVFSHGANFVLLIGLSMFLILFFGSKGLMRMIIRSEEIYTASLDYLRFRKFGILFVTFNFLFRSFFVGISRTNAITFSTLIMAVTNIILDYALIFGHWGFPQMGIEGAALASLAAEVAACAFFWLFAFFRVPQAYGLFRRHPKDWRLAVGMLKVAFPSMLQRFFSFGTYFVFFILIEKMGETALGVSSVVRSVYLLLIIPSIAFSATSNTLTSRMIGEGKGDLVGKMLWKVAANCLCCTLPFVLLTFCIPFQVVQIYTSDLPLARAAVPTLYTVGVAALLSSVTMTFFEAVSGTGNTTVALLLEMGVLVVYVSYIYVSSRSLPIHAVWLAECIYYCLLGIISFLYIRKAGWRRKRL